MYGMYGAVGGVGQSKNPFITRPGAGVSENNPFTANKTQDKTNFDPQQLFKGGQVGLGPETEAKQRMTIGIA